MKKVIVCIVFIITSLSNDNPANSIASFPRIAKQTTYVLICDSPNAYAYHVKYCHGLNSCKREIMKVSLEKAIELGRKPCGNCYRL